MVKIGRLGGTTLKAAENLYDAGGLEIGGRTRWGTLGMQEGLKRLEDTLENDSGDSG